ncbi:MAG: PLP-dependent cysteine synthase family protein [Deltaproteobacteria bacterium]|nr:PLP-dependent cysteine synthase family protein [Deltaproteobacteria bacterium]
MTAQSLPTPTSLDSEADPMLVARAQQRAKESIVDLVGRTPLVRLATFEKDCPNVEIWAKCEFMNPGGSVKDRAASQIIRDAIAAGKLTRDKELIDASSGNTGIAYSLIGGALGYKVKLVLPENVSWVRKKMSQAFGTTLVFSSEMEGSDGAIRLCRKLVAEDPERYFYPDQYGNESNPRGHFLTTASEIWEQTAGTVTHFVAGIGTSGTIMGTGRGLRAKNEQIEVWAVEPDDALHGLEGLKHMESSIIPDIYKPDELTGIIAMPTDEAWDIADRLSTEAGILVGHSSGAALGGAVRIAKKLSAAGKSGVVVTVFPDRADRYFEAPRPVKTS